MFMKRPMTFVSMPAPLTFLPISSTISTSISSNGSFGASSFALRCRTRSDGTISSGSDPRTSAVSS